MVGEIRDAEVASTAVHASLTGHLVFSTLHTNDAAGTFPRLIDMGVNADIIGASVTVSMAQRLVRRLCPECRESRIIEGKDKEIMDRLLKNIPHPEDIPPGQNTMWVPKGCPKCGGIGYKGRIAVVEVILMDREMEQAVRKSSSERDLWVASAHQQIRRMAQDGAIKVLQGVTSLDELTRMVDVDDDTLALNVV
jgi:type II secretory ATPase GspE/PulE/Tfp pilus assembly ATPase PilB-like protein